MNFYPFKFEIGIKIPKGGDEKRLRRGRKEKEKEDVKDAQFVKAVSDMYQRIGNQRFSYHLCRVPELRVVHRLHEMAWYGEIALLRILVLAYFVKEKVKRKNEAATKS